MDDQIVTLLLRLVHIVGDIFWVGAMFLMAGFLIPTARATGRDGGKFMQHLMQQRHRRQALGDDRADCGAGRTIRGTGG